jgi:hypothetical protein
MSPSQDRQLGGAEALENLEPQDLEESLKRALVYCHCLHAYSKRHIEALLTRVRAGEFGEGFNHIVESGISDYSFGKALKILTCISVHIVGLDRCGQNGPNWLIDFLFETLRETDNLFPDPGAEEIIQRHGSCLKGQMIHGIAIDACEALGLGAGEKSLAPAAALEQSLSGAGPYLSELLVFALSQPFDALRNHLQTLE